MSVIGPGFNSLHCKAKKKKKDVIVTVNIGSKWFTLMCKSDAKTEDRTGSGIWVSLHVLTPMKWYKVHMTHPWPNSPTDPVPKVEGEWEKCYSWLLSSEQGGSCRRSRSDGFCEGGFLLHLYAAESWQWEPYSDGDFAYIGRNFKNLEGAGVYQSVPSARQNGKLLPTGLDAICTKK